MNNRNLLKLIYVGSTLFAAFPGWAQQTSDDEKRSDTALLEEIIITSERREQSLQEVPLSVTAFGAETRDRIGILSIQNMADFTPGVSYNTSNDSPSIRGIGRQSNIFSLDSPVANYFDGVYTSSVQDAQRRPIFVERTEILRGPQGALSGRGSIAGAVNTYSKRPTDNFEGEVRGFAENYSRYGSEITLSGPITDWLRTRINLGAYRQDDGFFTNVANGESEGNQPNNRENADYLFDVDITENVDLFLKFSFADYEESRRSVAGDAPYAADVLGGTPTAYGTLGSPLVPVASYGYYDPTGTVLGDVRENPVITRDDKRYYNNNFRAKQRLDDQHNYTAHLTWHSDLFDIKWIGGHQNYEYNQWTDADLTSVTSMTIYGLIGGATFVPRVVNPSAVNHYMEQREWFSNEITISSVSDGPVQWIGGIYQSNEDYLQQPFTVTHEGYNELSTPAGFAVNQQGNASVFGEIDGETKSSAVFGQIDWQMIDQLKFTFGLRYNKDEKTATEQTRYVANNVGFGLFLAGLGSATDVTPLPSVGPLPVGVKYDYGIDPVSGNRVRDLEGDWSAVAGTIGLDYTPNDDHLIYVRAASGYRPGGFNAGFIAGQPQVEEEKVTSLEIGYKATLAERLQLSTSAFYYDFKDQQLELPALGRCTDPNDLNTCTIVDNFFNIPKTVNMGLEVELNWFVTDDFRLLATYGYLHTEIKDGLVDGNGFQNPEDPAALLPNANRHFELVGQTDAGYTNENRWTQDLTGNELKDAPPHKFALNGSYHFGFDAGDLTLSANYIWRDGYFSDVFETEPGKVDSYDMVDMRAIWTDAADVYSIIVYASNIFDEEAAISGGITRRATPASGADGQAYFKTYNLAPPRSYGLELQYRFGG